MMRKILITLIVVIGAYSATFAQGRYRRADDNSPEFGFNVGYNAAYVQESDSYFSSDVISGFNLSVFGDIPISDRWSIKVKGTYDQKGYGNGFILDDQGNEVDGVDFRLNYITVPVLATWHFGRSRNWYLHFGPYAGFLLNAKETQDNIDVKDSFNTTDFGIDLGIGVKFPITNNTKLFLEYDGQGGFLNIFKDGGGTTQNLRTSFNFGVSFAVK